LQKLLYNSVLPTVRELTDIADHLVIILPTLLALIANSTDDEYRSLLVPELRKVITMTRPVQVSSAANYSTERQVQAGPILSVFPALIVHSELESVHPGFPVAFIS